MKGTIVALFACALFGTVPALGKLLLESMDAMTLTMLRCFLSGIFMIIALRVVHKITEVEHFSRETVLPLFYVSLFGGAIGPLFLFAGLEKTSATNAILLTRMMPVFMGILAFLLLKERMHRNQITGGVIMILGVVVISTHGLSASMSPEAGDFLILLAAFFLASANIVMKRYLCKVPPEAIVTVRNSLAGVILLLFTFDNLSQVTFTSELLLSLAGVVILGTVMAQDLWYKALEMTSASNVALAELTGPVFGVFFALLLVPGEQLFDYQIYGGLLILAGLVFIHVHLSQIRGLESHLKTKMGLHF